MSVEVLEMLEATLIPVVGPKVIGPDGRAWPDVPRTMPEQYEKWSDAQILSLAATEKFANFKDIIYPLSKTKNVTVLDNMWKFIDTVSSCSICRTMMHIETVSRWEELQSCIWCRYRLTLGVGTRAIQAYSPVARHRLEERLR